MKTFTTKRDAINHIIDGLGSEGGRELAERVFASLRAAGTISADDRGLRLADDVDLTAEAARLLESMTDAQRVSLEMGEDGQEWTAPDGRSLQQVCRARGCISAYRRQDGGRRYEMPDGSAVVALPEGWDLQAADCTCGWCWDGAGAHCDEQGEVEEYGLSAATMDPEDAEHEAEIEAPGARGTAMTTSHREALREQRITLGLRSAHQALDRLRERLPLDDDDLRIALDVARDALVVLDWVRRGEDTLAIAERMADAASELVARLERGVADAQKR